MAYSSEHLLYTFSGGLPGGEQWSVGLRTQAAAITDPDTLGQYAVEASDAFKTAWNGSNGLKQWNPNTVSFTNTVVRHVNTAGHTTNQASNANTGAVGANPAQTAPNQGSVVVSLLTNRTGRSYRGRIYLPVLSPSWVIATGRLDVAMRDGLGVNMVLLLQALSALTTATPSTGPFPLAIQSQVSGQPPAVITQLKVGDVLDTQRRRRDKLIENYYVSGV